ncbi:MAG TPA: hypothetical protein VFY06_02450 [Verrucomicrobiae bacterium]|nr:hypothetical protein [Verrucomicrobiae bacterium]
MKLSVFAFVLVLTAGIFASGCSTFHKQKTSATASKPDSAIVTPDTSLTAKVVRYEPTGRFVVLNFPVGQMPAIGQTLFLYRNGLKEGEVKVSGPQQESFVVADVIAGDAKVGDEVRNR